MRSASDLLRAIYDLFQPLAGSQKKKNKIENKEEMFNPECISVQAELVTGALMKS